MKTKETITSQYYVLAVAGMYQRWDRNDGTKLTDPVPFCGVVQDTKWGCSIGENFNHAHHFEKPASATIDPKNFGPWWYTVTEQSWVRVDVTTTIERDVLFSFSAKPFRCKYCGCPTTTDPADQSPPLAECNHTGEKIDG